MEKIVYKVICAHPMCHALRENCPHGHPHPYFEEECEEIHCLALDGPSWCELIRMVEKKEKGENNGNNTMY